ncbi:MAG: TatD family hydrolase [Candidatus Eisenbacteria sp.]|nr:TatD family hydrolase [Candidatus Eisenbacteria bacterium]
MHTTFKSVIDCHAHLEQKHLARGGFGLDQILARCEQHGVTALIYSLFLQDDELELPIEVIEGIASRHRVSVGISFGIAPPLEAIPPSALVEQHARAAQRALKLAVEGRILAIGEVGLDYYWPVVEYLHTKGVNDQAEVVDEMQARLSELLETEPVRNCLESQVEVFKSCINMAIETDLPLVTHGRDAYDDILEIVARSVMNPERVVPHCFAGSPAQALEAARKGYRISIPSSVGYRSEFANVARAVDLSHLVIETDSPYHSPFVGMWQKADSIAKDLMPRKAMGRTARDKWVAMRRRELFLEQVESQYPGLSFPTPEAGQVRFITAGEYLASSSRRRENEPTFVRSAATQLARVKGLDEKTVCEITAANTLKVFPALRPSTLL